MEDSSHDAREGSIDDVQATIQVMSGVFQLTAGFVCVKKHSWRGKYKRIFCIGKGGVLTKNGATLEITNAWPYEDEENSTNPQELFGDIMPNGKVENEFTILLKKGRKTTNMTFICDMRSAVLTEANKYRFLFAEKKSRSQQIVHKAKRWRWSEARVDVLLSPSPCALKQLDLLHFFICDKRDDLMRQMIERAQLYIGVHIVVTNKKNGTNWYMQNFQDQRLGAYSDNESVTSISEFPVKKYSPRHSNGEVPVARIMCLTEKCVVERDPGSYNIVTA
eukprot:Ihof_evm2s287 gene=Ihof_evmTU2s287